MSHRVGLEIGLPGSDVDYQKVTYDTQAFFPIGSTGFVLRGYGKLGYGNDLPFYKTSMQAVTVLCVAMTTVP